MAVPRERDLLDSLFSYSTHPFPLPGPLSDGLSVVHGRKLHVSCLPCR
jgi:hypothetical protein